MFDAQCGYSVAVALYHAVDLDYNCSAAAVVGCYRLLATVIGSRRQAVPRSMSAGGESK